MPNIDDLLKGMTIDTPDSVDLRKFKATIDGIEQIKIASERRVAKAREQLEKQLDIDYSKRAVARAKKELKRAEDLAKDKNGAELEAAKKLIEEKKKLADKAEKELAGKREEAEKRAVEIAIKYEENYYNKLDIYSKQRYAEDQKRLLERQKNELASLEAMAEAQARTDEDRAKVAREYEQKRKDNEEALLNAIKKEKDLKEKIAKIEDEVNKKLKVRSGLEKASYRKSQAEKKAEASKQRIEDIGRQYAIDLAGAKTDEERQAIEARYQEELKQAKAEQKQATKESATAQMQYNLLAGIGKAVTNLVNSVNDAVNSAVKTVASYQSGMLARLQGSRVDYYGAMDTIKSNLAVSPFVSFEKTLKNLSELVDRGIAYNIEERAFLATISDKIATTFDAFDSNLLRLIRLQQADSTAARLGMEARLTRFFNEMFSDTSYLKDMYDTVSAAVVDASSQLTYAQSSEFEYILQKWMGSLYALGFSQNAVSRIAEGVNYLATGNVKALAGNESLQTLLAMSASRSGTVSYAEAMIEGLDASKTNDLLKSMVEYLREIAINSDNKVVKAAYGDIFDMSLSDFAAIQNLQQKDITAIYNSTLTYGGALSELRDQFVQVTGRLSFAELMSNLLDNFTFSIGESIAESPVMYPTWAIADLIEKSTGGIHLPAISVLGNMIDLSAFTIEGIIKSGMVGISTLAMIPSIVSSISNKGGLSGDLAKEWNAVQTLTRGTGLDLGFTESTLGTSEMQYVGSGSETDIKETSLAQANLDVESVKKVTGVGGANDKTLNDLWNALYVEPIPIQVQSETLTQLIKDVSNGKVIDVKITNDALNVNSSVKSVSKNTIDELSTMLSEKAIATMSETVEEGYSEEEEASMKDLIQKLLNGVIDVNIKNDEFDTYIRKNLFQA